MNIYHENYNYSNITQVLNIPTLTSCRAKANLDFLNSILSGSLDVPDLLAAIPFRVPSHSSIKSGASADTVYKPKLWYFSLLSFLGDQDTPRTSHSSLKTILIMTTVFLEDSDNEEQTPQVLVTSSAVSEKNIFHDEAQSSDPERIPINIRRKKQRFEVEKQEALASEAFLDCQRSF
ncbi:hypothetical protein QTP88_010697 [Uroleucon formosanum]